MLEWYDDTEHNTTSSSNEEEEAKHSIRYRTNIVGDKYFIYKNGLKKLLLLLLFLMVQHLGFLYKNFNPINNFITKAEM